MCIICAKANGVKRPTNEQIDAMITANPHGFGLATFEGGKIVVRKTMDASLYKQWAQSVSDETPAIFHMRIATHGSISEKNCHPFLSEDGQWAFAHNGVLTIANEGDMTDSETFFKRMAMPMIMKGYYPTASDEVFDRMVECVIGSSKFVFMDNVGEIIRYGNWIEENGLFFSNGSYRPVVYDYSSLGFSTKNWFVTNGYKDVNNIGSPDYNALVEDLCEFFEYEPSAYDATIDELLKMYKAQFPKLKVKTLMTAKDEAIQWLSEMWYEPTDNNENIEDYDA